METSSERCQNCDEPLTIAARFCGSCGYEISAKDLVEESLRLRIKIVAIDEGIDEKELERLTWQMMREIRDLDVESVYLANSGILPRGAKSILPIIPGELVVAFADAMMAAIVVHPLVMLLQSRFSSERNKIICTIGSNKLELTGKNDEEQKRLIEGWIDNLKGRSIHE